MELSQQVGVDNVSFNQDKSSFLIFLLHNPYKIHFDGPCRSWQQPQPFLW